MSGYVRRGGVDVQPAPWECNDVLAYVFYLRADAAALHGLCERTLNGPSGGALKYRPVFPHIVVLTFQRLGGLRSASTHASQQARHSYSEATFWVMVKDDGERGRGVEFLIPYIFADSGMAVAAGREIYGYPKEHAAVRVPRVDEPANGFLVRGLAMDRFGAEAQANPDTEILRCSAVTTAQDDAADFNASLVAPLERQDFRSKFLNSRWMETPLNLVKGFINLLTREELDFVFLRQIGALGGGAGTDMQQVVGTSARPFVVRSLWPLRAKYRLHLPPLASHPIAADLGLDVTNDAADVMLGIRFELGFTLQPGRVIWP